MMKVGPESPIKGSRFEYKVSHSLLSTNSILCTMSIRKKMGFQSKPLSGFRRVPPLFYVTIDWCRNNGARKRVLFPL